MNIAVLITCHNRKEKTLSSLRHLFAACDAYNSSHDEQVSDGLKLPVFLVDDGCTDGTAEAVKEAFPSQQITIIQGSGSLFWAGGMREAWKEAMKSTQTWDYYLLLNDDTDVYENVFDELFEADEYGYKQAGARGISSGITCQGGGDDTISYGGFKFVDKSKGQYILVQPSGQPQEVDLSHANIMLVAKSVVYKIGIFYEKFQHACADNDYSMQALSHHLPVYVTSHICGECECDHDTNEDEIKRLMGMSLSERRRYVASPTHSDNDYLLFVKRNIPLKYPMSYLIRKVRVYFPKAYYHITNLRGIYKQ